MKPVLDSVVPLPDASPIRTVGNSGHIGDLTSISIEIDGRSWDRPDYEELQSRLIHFKLDCAPGIGVCVGADPDTGRLSEAFFWVRGDVTDAVMHTPLEVAQGVPVFDLAAYEGLPWEDEKAAQAYYGWDRSNNLFIGLEEPSRWAIECVVSPAFSLFFDSDRKLVGVIHRLLSRMDRLVIQQASMPFEPLPFAYFVGWPRDPTTSAN